VTDNHNSIGKQLFSSSICLHAPPTEQIARPLPAIVLLVGLESQLAEAYDWLETRKHADFQLGQDLKP
jgi:hypothetical protein